MKLIICDDETEILELLKPVFETRGAEVRCFSSGNGAMEAIERDLPDAVLTDLRMPDGTGVELLRRLRRHNQSAEKKIRVFVMTGTIDGGEGYLQALGVSRIWVKPFSVHELVSAVMG